MIFENRTKITMKTFNGNDVCILPKRSHKVNYLYTIPQSFDSLESLRYLIQTSVLPDVFNQAVHVKHCISGERPTPNPNIHKNSLPQRTASKCLLKSIGVQTDINLKQIQRLLLSDAQLLFKEQCVEISTQTNGQELEYFMESKQMNSNSSLEEESNVKKDLDDQRNFEDKNSAKLTFARYFWSPTSSRCSDVQSHISSIVDSEMNFHNDLSSHAQTISNSSNSDMLLANHYSHSNSILSGSTPATSSEISEDTTNNSISLATDESTGTMNKALKDMDEEDLVTLINNLVEEAQLEEENESYQNLYHQPMVAAPLSFGDTIVLNSMFMAQGNDVTFLEANGRVRTTEVDNDLSFVDNFGTISGYEGDDESLIDDYLDTDDSVSSLTEEESS